MNTHTLVITGNKTALKRIAMFAMTWGWFFEFTVTLMGGRELIFRNICHTPETFREVISEWGINKGFEIIEQQDGTDWR